MIVLEVGTPGKGMSAETLERIRFGLPKTCLICGRLIAARDDVNCKRCTNWAAGFGVFEA